MQHSKKIQSLEVEDVKAIEAQLPLHGQHPMALQLLDALHEVAVLTLNDDNEVSYANPFARLIFNLDAPKVKARKHKPTKSNLYYLLEKLQEQPSEFTLQYAVDSQVRTLKAYAIDLINQKTHQQLVYMFDTTSLVLSDLKLRETEALLQVLIDTSPDYICIKDGNNRWLKANQKLLSLFQINPESYAHQTNVEITRFNTLKSQTKPLGARKRHIATKKLYIYRKALKKP
ncbi:MAG: hypothetical protein B7Y32_06480 [Methylophilales bacterium 16-45-7]|nr:MAG: hypothetical protein B7Y32_06480 [Methylophilales bacterium 16-45-7]